MSQQSADLKHGEALPAIQTLSFCVKNILPWVAVEWLFQSLLVKRMPEIFKKEQRISAQSSKTK